MMFWLEGAKASGSSPPPEAVEGLREGLRDAAERLVFLPNVVGLDFDDIRRLDEDDDPWWQSVKQEAIVISGKRPEDVMSFDGEARG
ncbi:hypothetical protein [Sinorhizobium medicae]|uniref:hypothetical protein n=1 Tax=Sinorhizobium medicae TaxID=110321 RepID=UPI00308BFADB|nr:hypothetical protein U8C38_07110 [Sinorhizobium medicae]